MRQQITRVSIVQSSKIMAAFYVLMGCFYAVAGVFMLLFGGAEMRVTGIIFLLMPVFMGIFGFIWLAFFAWVYNVLAKVLGGVEFELTDVGE